jgi:acyl transferase domain-containing protein
LTPLFGHAHAASGLLHVAAAAIACHYRLQPARGKSFPAPWVPVDKIASAQIDIQALGAQRQRIFLTSGAPAQGKPYILRAPPRLYCFAGDNRAEVIQRLQSYACSWKGVARLVIVADDEEALKQKQAVALQLLADNKINPALPHYGIYYRDAPLAGDIAFVFASSNTSYPDMGIDLTLAFPEFLDEIQQYYPHLQRIIDMLYGKAFVPGNFLEESKANIFITWLHCLLSREVLGIKPAAALGHSLGEPNALTVLGMFRDPVEMDKYAIGSKIFTHLLDGEYRALRQSYPQLQENEIAWENWRIDADVNAVKTVVAAEKYCHLTIINSDHDCVIGGLPQACQQVIAQLAPKMATKLKLNFMVHCPEVNRIANEWRELHHRTVYPQDLRFYSCISGKPYPLTSDTIADQLLQLGTSTVDFPLLIKNAWDDGVRIFIEHGPQGLCSYWIKEILGDRDYLVTHFDQMARPPLAQIMHVIAELIAAGVDVNYQAFSARVHP